HSKNILIDDGKVLIINFGISSRFNNTTASISGVGNNMDYLNLYEKCWSSDLDVRPAMNEILAKFKNYDANEGSNTFNSFEGSEISSTNDKNNNDQATLSTLISSSPENKRIRIEASDEQSWFQHDEINMQQLYEINMQNAQNATSHATISSPHAKQSHVSSSSNIISASNANALRVENTLQYASNSMRVHHNRIGAVNQMKISKYNLVFMVLRQQFKLDISIALHQLLASYQDCSFYLSHRMNDVLAKPFSKSMFLKMLENYCSHLVMPKFQNIPRPFGVSDMSKSASNSDIFSHSSDISVMNNLANTSSGTSFFIPTINIPNISTSTQSGQISTMNIETSIITFANITEDNDNPLPQFDTTNDHK
ncbi:1425_t:CDS:2, partial [Racocetra persica]